MPRYDELSTEIEEFVDLFWAGKSPRAPRAFPSEIMSSDFRKLRRSGVHSLGEPSRGMAETEVLGDLPYATPELPPKASTACPADLGRFSLSEFTPTKRGSPKVNTPSTETKQMQHAGVNRGACPLPHALSLQVLRGISPTGAAKRCLLDLLEMENRRETPATPSRGRRDVLHIAPGAPKRRLGSLEREPDAQRRTLSLDCDPDMGFFHEETPLAKRARLW